MSEAQSMTLTALWRRISRFYRESGRSIQLCVGFTADASAAAKSFKRLLRASLILCQEHPVEDYADLAAIAQVGEPEQRELYVLIGCGAGLDLSNFLPLDRTEVHVLTSERPVHLSNLRNTTLFFWNYDEIRRDVNVFFRRHATNKRRRHDSDDESSSGSDSDDDGHSTDMDETAQIDWMDPRAVPPRLERLYYSTSFDGASAAVTLYELAVELHQSDESFLWHAAIGLTDLYLRHRRDPSSFTVEISKMRDAVHQLNASRRAALAEAPDANAACYQQSRISSSTEYSPWLLRHWSLWDSLWHETVFAARAGLHHPQHGEEQLRDLLVKAGVPISQARKPWCEIPIARRNEILSKLLPLLVEVVGNEHPVNLPTICRSTGFGTEVSTFDACRLFIAQLTAPLDLRMGNVVTPEQRTSHRRHQFWIAHNVLDADPHSKQFCSALKAVYALQRDIVDATTVLMQRGAVVTARTLHYALISENARRPEISCAIRLRSLADHLLPALTAERVRRQQVRPLLLCDASYSDSPWHTVVLFNPQLGSPSLAVRAITHFQAAIQDLIDTETEASGKDETSICRRTSVDTSVVYINGRENATHFVESVHLRLASSIGRRS